MRNVALTDADHGKIVELLNAQKTGFLRMSKKALTPESRQSFRDRAEDAHRLIETFKQAEAV